MAGQQECLWPLVLIDGIHFVYPTLPCWGTFLKDRFTFITRGGGPRSYHNFNPPLLFGKAQMKSSFKWNKQE